MKKLKSLICTFMTAVLALSVIHTPYVSAGVREQDAKIDFLINVGIMDPITDEQVQLVDTVKRKDFAVLMTRLLRGGQDAPSGAHCEFTDIDYSDPTTPDVIYAYQNNIMNGYGDGKFYPEVAVKYEEAVKCLVCILGYNSEAQILGGYPQGYMQTAVNLKLLDGINALSGEFISLKELALLIYNCLEVPYMTLSYENGQPQYVKVDGHTILSDSFDMYESKGIITSNSQTSLDSDAKVADGYVMIDDEIYGVGTTNAAELIGQYVKFYYVSEGNDDEKTLSFLYPYENKNNVLTVLGEDIADVSIAYGGGNSLFKYYVNGINKSETVKISPVADVILNGMACLEYSKETFMPDTGSVTLIDNTGDTIYDVIIIDSTATYVVKNVSPYFGTLTDYYAKAEDDDNDDSNNKNLVLNIDENDTRNTITVIKPDGTVGSTDDILPWDVLAVKEAVFGSRRTVSIEISRNVITGKITARNDETITINNTAYEYNSSFKKYIADGTVNLVSGVSLDFCLDINGRVAAVKENNFTGEYYYINKCYDSEDGSGNVLASVWNIATDEWETCEFDCSKKIRIDEISCNVSEVKALQKSFVRLFRNNSGIVTKIYKCEAEFEDERNLQRNSATNAYVDNSSGGDVSYYASDTVLITIPENDEYENDKSMYVKRISNFGDTKYRSVQLYDVDNYIPAIIVFRSNVVTNSDNVSLTLPTFVVTKIGQEVFDEEVYTKLIGYNSSGEVSYLIDQNTEESDAFKSLNLGDFIRLETNMDGIGTAMAIDFSSKEKTVKRGGVPYTYGSSFTDLNVFCGKVAEIDHGANIIKIEHCYGNDITSNAISVFRIPSVVLINDSTKDSNERFELSTGKALQEGQFIAVRRRAGSNQIAEIFID